MDALRNAHLNILKYVLFAHTNYGRLSPSRITKVYETETYDYPVHIQESIFELSSSVAHNVTNFAATNLKGTNIPAPSVAPAPKVLPKTLPHALSRAAIAGSSSLGPDLRLSKALHLYGGAFEKVKIRVSTRASSILKPPQYRSELLDWNRTMSFLKDFCNHGKSP